MVSSEKLRTVWTNPIHFLAFSFGSGLAPFMPGTFGTLAAVPIYLLIADFSLPIYIAIVFMITLLCIWLSHVTARDLGIHDYTGVNCDEVVGYLLTMVAVPKSWVWLVLGFLLFRLFDIWKPWPIRWIDEHVHGGFGMVLDDMAAALFAWLVLQLILLLKIMG